MAVQNTRTDEEDKYIFEPGKSPEKGSVVCTRCGKVFKGVRLRWENVFCPECNKLRAEQKAMEQREERYLKYGTWNTDSHLDSNAQKAKTHGVSYGMYMAMKNAGWL